MSWRRVTCWSLALGLVGGCGTPTLWIGTAHSDVAGQPASEPAPWRAADSGMPALAAVSQPSAAVGVAPDAGTSSVLAADAGQPGLAAGSGSPTQAGGSIGLDDDAGAPPRASDQGDQSDPGDPGDPGDQADPTRAALVPAHLPKVGSKCPNLNGYGTYTFSAGGRSLLVQIYMRPDAKSLPAPGGPLILYFHSLGADASEVTSGFTQASIDNVVAQGGVVASFNDTPCLTCGLPDDVVWYDEDDVVSDQVVACAIEKAQIDTRRIHAVGFSSGALHSMHLVLARSNYIASVVSYSGGMPLAVSEPQDPENKVPALLSYGREGLDNAVAADFNVGSRNWYDTYAPKGYYSLLCDHDGGHMIPSDLPAHVLRFLLDHPYRVQPEPYRATVPTEFPSYCRNGPP